jgi:hypothetical protein
VTQVTGGGARADTDGNNINALRKGLNSKLVPILQLKRDGVAMDRR